MKKLFILPLVVITFSSFSQKKTDWKLVWSDEFNYAGKPDPKKWDIQLGNKRNHESQCYTNSPENVFVKNGYLNLVALKKTVHNPNYSPIGTEWWQKDESYNYTSGDIYTKNTASWLYGKIEVRAKVPPGKGTWPAIWMEGLDREKLNWPKHGEIDIMEYQGYRPTYTSGALHFANSENAAHVKSGKEFLVPRPLHEDFHIFGMVWTPKSIELYIDNIPFHKFNLDTASISFKNKNRRPYEWNSDIVYHKQPFYLILNLALGGSAGGPIDDSILPATFLVDYVRVYQKDKY